VFKKYPQPEQKRFEEAKGQVINDYQIVLEEKWINTLKKKYPVKINKPLLMNITRALK
jgi:peptidyl-prolyl cis-trans isomerase SurA